MRTLVLTFLLAAAGCLAVSAAPVSVAEVEVAETMMGLPLVFADNFEDGKADGWKPTDPAAWRVDEIDGNHFFEQFKASDYKPAVRSPFNIAWTENVAVSDFVLEANLWQTGRDYGHRDMCVFFGKQDPSHFYYVHMATKADPHANNIFIVNGEPRVAIADETTTGTDWGTGWHHVRIVRKVDDGSIKVFFDNMEKPIMTAVNKTFLSGPVGFGTFDDTGRVDNVRLYGKKVEMPEGAMK